MSILHDELQAAGFIPVATPVEGAEAWTSWRSPAPEVPVYERYYELVKQAMYAQVDLPVTERIACRPLTCKPLMLEIVTVVNCWRSARRWRRPTDERGMMITATIYVTAGGLTTEYPDVDPRQRRSGGTP